MHASSLEHMEYFCEKYLTVKQSLQLSIFDLGSLDVCGSYKPLFDNPQWTYTGIDLEQGKNVDIVLTDPYTWNQIPDQCADVFISGQAFEHIEFFWLTMAEISRVLVPGGYCCIIAPSGGYEHRYPLDCWRFYPDGFRALARFSGLEVLEIRQTDPCKNYEDESSLWADTVLIAQKSQKLDAAELTLPEIKAISRQDRSFALKQELVKANFTAAERLDEIKKLRAGLANAENLAVTRMKELENFQREFEILQSQNESNRDELKKIKESKIFKILMKTKKIFKL